MGNIFYVTTPIYYVNDEPHLGHAYTTILADVLARYARLRGEETFFLTGTDEHGQKVERAARERGISPLEHANNTVVRFQEAWKHLHISNDDFIRTTEERHIRVVTAVLQNLWDKGDIYKAEYAGWYCVPDERFWTEKDLVEGNCPDCGRPVEQILESNYFFRMGKYQDWLVDYIQTHPDYIQPESRKNEVLGFLRNPLEDLCISRPVNRLSWGIPLPFDTGYVTYVWFDALINYTTAVGYLSNEVMFNKFWPHVIHLIGKDILTTHSVYWSTMLKALDLPLPKTILAHGWWVIKGTKMSKSLGNVVKPLDLANVYGVDAFRYFLMREMTLGRDADFSEESIAARYNADLANDLGNLLSRVVAMIDRYFEGYIPQPGEETAEDTALRESCVALVRPALSAVKNLAINEALAGIMECIGGINRYLEQTAPWQKVKADKERAGTILYYAGEALRFTSVLLFPVLPERITVLWERLGWQPADELRDGLAWGQLSPGVLVQKGDPLFPRDLDQ
jgi:methionyl-tRNA synthetase